MFWAPVPVETEIMPEYVPVAKPNGEIETVSVDGVVELAGVTVSHPPALKADAVKLVAVAALTERSRMGVWVAPCWYKNERVFGVTASAVPLLTISVTASVCDPFDDPPAVTVTLPE
jgi:hypothetical protein